MIGASEVKLVKKSTLVNSRLKNKTDVSIFN